MHLEGESRTCDTESRVTILLKTGLNLRVTQREILYPNEWKKPEIVGDIQTPISSSNLHRIQRKLYRYIADISVLQFSFFSLVIMLTLCLLTTYVFLCHHFYCLTQSWFSDWLTLRIVSHLAYQCDSMTFHMIPSYSLWLIPCITKWLCLQDAATTHMYINP